MKWIFPQLVLCCLLIIFQGCGDDVSPDNCTNASLANFQTVFSNGGVPVDNVTLNSMEPNADRYFWDVEGQTSTAPNVNVTFTEVGNYTATLEVEKEGEVCQFSQVIEIDNTPTNGTSALIVSGDGNIYYRYLDNPNATPMDVGNVPANDELDGLAWDHVNKEIFFSGSIFKAKPNGAGSEKIIDDEFTFAIDLDPEDNLLFFSSSNMYSEFFIKRANLNGDDVATVHQTFLDVQYLRVDRNANKIYYVDEEGPTQIFNIPYSGGMPESNEYAINERKNAMAFDENTGDLYFASGWQTNTIYKVTAPITSNSVPEIVVPEASIEPILGMDYDEKDQRLYWTDASSQELKMLDFYDLDSGVQTVAEDIGNPRTVIIINAD